MAQHCTNCGHELQGTEKFCAECGAKVGGGQAAGAPGHWEYKEFVVGLGPTSVRDTGAFLLSGGIPDERLARIVNDAVRRKLTEIATEGWEPMESVSANSLWHAKKVGYTQKSGWWSGKVTTTLVDVRFDCRRRV